MNNKLNILERATFHLEENTGISTEIIVSNGEKEDNFLVIHLNGKNWEFIPELKHEVRTQNVLGMKEKGNSKILVAERISPNTKSFLREKKIPYLEVNGNIFIQRQDLYIWVDTNKPAPIKKKKNKAFTPKGLQVLFHYLVDDEFINLTQRGTAMITKVGLGQVNNVIRALKEQGYIIENHGKKILHRKNDLLVKWVNYYQDKLKPGLFLGKFRFLKEAPELDWKQIQLKKGETFWGNETAGALLTQYLNPKVLTLFTSESKAELMKNYKLIPDQNGNVEVYKKFWGLQQKDETQTVPPILVYADLLESTDQRCLETAKIIQDEYISGQFK